MPLSADIARCLNEDCPLRPTCGRAEVNDNPRQVYAAFEPDHEIGCDFHIPKEKRR